MVEEVTGTPEDKELDELDTWFDDVEEDEDPTAGQEEEDDDGTSTDDDESTDDPVNEVPESDAEVAALDEGNPTEPPKEGNPYDWVEALDPEFRSKVEDLVQSDRSQRGRVAALQRQLDSTAAKREAEQRVQPQGAAPSAVPVDKNIEDMSDEELDTFLEEYPSVARNVNKLIEKRVAKEREVILGEVRPIQQEALQNKLEQSRQALRKEAEYIFNTAETGIHLEDVLNSRTFRDWVADQPAEYQTFASNAESVEAAAKVLYDFAVYTEEHLAAQATGNESAAAEDVPVVTSAADQTAARRQQARKGSTPASRSAPTANADSGSYEAMFNSFVEADERNT